MAVCGDWQSISQHSVLHVLSYAHIPVMTALRVNNVRDGDNSDIMLVGPINSGPFPWRILVDHVLVGTSAVQTWDLRDCERGFSLHIWFWDSIQNRHRHVGRTYGIIILCNFELPCDHTLCPWYFTDNQLPKERSSGKVPFVSEYSCQK